MLFNAATILALVSAAFATHLEKRAVDPASASFALFAALPTSLQAVALTNPAAAASEISSEFLTGTPTWFTKLPSDVQTYFITAGNAAVPTTTSLISATNGTALNSSRTSTSSGSANQTSALISGATSSRASTTTLGAASTTSRASSTSTGGASMPTHIIGAGIAGALGFLGMLAL